METRKGELPLKGFPIMNKPDHLSKVISFNKIVYYTGMNAVPENPEISPECLVELFETRKCNRLEFLASVEVSNPFSLNRKVSCYGMPGFSCPKVHGIGHPLRLNQDVFFNTDSWKINFYLSTNERYGFFLW